MEKKRSSFTGRVGFVLAAAGSAVGLGNLWRFPYFLQNGLCRFTDSSITKFLNTKGQLLPEEYFSAIRRIFPVKLAPFFP